MLHLILQYPEVVSNPNIVNISTMPLEPRASTVVVSDSILEEGTSIQSFRVSLSLDDYRLHNPSQIFILDYLKLSKLSVDKVTHFSLRPPEFFKLCDGLGEYYKWFLITLIIKSDQFKYKITTSLATSS